MVKYRLNNSFVCHLKTYEDSILYCKIHAKKYTFTPTNIIDYFTSCDEQKCCYIGKNKCEKNAKYKHNNNYYCALHRKTIYNRYLVLNKITHLLNLHKFLYFHLVQYLIVINYFF